MLRSYIASHKVVLFHGSGETEARKKTNSFLLQANFMLLKRLEFHAQYFSCIIHDITCKRSSEQKIFINEREQKMISFRH